MRHLSLRVRLGLAAGLAVAIAVIAVAVSAWAGTRSVLLGQVDNSLSSLTRQRLHQINGAPGGPGGGGPQNGGPGSLFGTGGFAPEGPCQHDEGTGLDAGHGQPYGAAPGIFQLIYPSSCGGGTWKPPAQTYRLPVSEQMQAVADSGRGQFFTDVTVSGHHLRVQVSGIGENGALAVALPLADIDHTLNSQLLLLAVIAAAGIALAGLLAILVARTALAPIARFTRQTESIAANAERTERERLDVEGGDELARLAATFNATLDALERSVQAQRNLVADASHELRTPIASIRANLQLLRDEALLSPEDRAALRADMIEELDELTKLVGDVVELARGAKLGGDLGDVRLDEIVSDLVERARRRSPELTFVATVEPTLVRGEGERIARAISNLLDNAAKWSPEGGAVEVELGDGTVSVRDHGPGFREEDLPFVFDRFHRAKAARAKPGSGLGLAIVRQAAEAHGGFVEAGNAPGGGALLRIAFGRPLELEEPAALSAG